MRKTFGHLGGLLLVLMMLVFNCQSSSNSPTLMAQDTLEFVVEQQIEDKKHREEKVKNFQRRYLPRNFPQQVEKYLPHIRKYTKRYGLDWRLIVAQILKESYFEEDARSHVGAVGLMQIMPKTAKEITREMDYAYITKDPRENITAGIYHLYKQVQLFPEADPENRLKLALAAYNCGVARIFDARDIARFKELDPDTWDAIKECLPLLTVDHWTLHLEVWEQGTPTYGYFYGYEQTIDYVDDIFEKYYLLKQMYKLDISKLDLKEIHSNL